MDQAKTETPTGDAADKFIRLRQTDSEAAKKLEDNLRLKQLAQTSRKAKESLRQAKKDAVTEAEAILYAPQATENAPNIAQKQAQRTELAEAKDAALVEAEGILQETKMAPRIGDPQKELKKHFKGTYSQDVSVASFHLKKLQSFLNSSVELPNREEVEEQIRLRAKEIYLRKMGEKDTQ